jgi:outer membrane protein assembly factor BamB
MWTLPVGADSQDCRVKVAPSVAAGEMEFAGEAAFAMVPYAAGEPVEAEWATLGGDAARRGLSEYTGPKLGCLKWAQGAAGAVVHGVAVGSGGQVYSVTVNGILTAIDADGHLLWEYAMGDSEILQMDLVGGQYSGSSGMAGTYDALMAWAEIPYEGYTGLLVGLGSVWLDVVERNGVPVLAFRSLGSGYIYGTTAVNSTAGTRVGVAVPQDARNWSDVQLYIEGRPEVRMEAHGTYTVPREITTLDIRGSNGQIKVYRGAEDVVSHPTVGPDGTIYVGFGNVLYAVAPDGQLRWKHETGAFVYSCPAVDDAGRVFFGSADGAVYALGPDGGELWRFDVPGPGAIGGSVLQPPSIGKDGSVYVGGLYKSTLYALDPADGGVRWQSQLTAGGETGGSFIVAPVVGPDGTVYVTMLDDPHLYALDLADGSVKWATNLAHEPELVGYWKFDEGTGNLAYDSSVYERHLSTSSVFRYPPGVLDEALRGSGAYPGTAQRFGWDEGTIGRTMCFWVRTDGTTGNLVTWSGADSVTLRIHDGLRVRAAINGGYLVAKTPLRTNEWQHVAIVVSNDGATTGMDDVRIYLDGRLDADATDNGGFAPNTTPLRITTASTGSINVYTSTFVHMDDLRLYETALDLEQIEELMWDETAPTFSVLRPATSSIAQGRYSWGEVAVSADGTIYAGFDDPYLRAINPDGSVRWVKHLACGGNYTMTVGVDNFVYAAGADGVLYAIRPDGKLVSRFDAAAAARYIETAPTFGRLMEDVCELNYPVVANNGTVYASDTGGRVWAISRDACEGRPYALTCQDLLGDVNKDCLVNLADFAFIAADWLGCTDSTYCDDGQKNPWHYVPGYWSSDPALNKYLPGDINQSRYVGLDDVAWMMRIWLNGAGLYD